MRRLLVVFLVLCGIAALAAVAGILLSRGGGPIAGPTVLVWRIDRPLVEQAAVSGFPFGSTVDSMAEIYPALAGARRDPAVRGLVLYLQDTPFGLAKAQEIRRQVAALRRAGKFVECYLETAGEGSNGTLAYYLATACQRIHLAPGGDLNLLGLFADSLFLRGTLDKLGVEPEIRHVGRYKSAAETYTRTEHSPEAEAALGAVLDSYYGQIVAAIAGARGKSPAEVRRLIDRAPYDAGEALRLRLVDALAYPDQFKQHLTALAGGEPRLVRLQDYRPGGSLAGTGVAVVFARGAIVRGDGGVQPWTEESFLGSDAIALVLRDLAEDGSVAAVVLRIDSPGGSALASDLILREVESLKKRKPVVVSMSDLAASGGYYIAAKATKIVAEPATLTGSIGVVGGKLVTRRLEQEKLGLTHDPLKRGANADLYSAQTSFSPEQAARVELLMRRVYDTFVGHVAAGRRMTRSQVEAIAEGRIWSGADARRLGLVDDLGGLDRALELAREAAGLAAGASLRLEFHPAPPTWLDLLRERREPLLPVSVRRLASELEPRPVRSLELPPELAGLARPF